MGGCEVVFNGYWGVICVERKEGVLLFETVRMFDGGWILKFKDFCFCFGFVIWYWVILGKLRNFLEFEFF